MIEHSSPTESKLEEKDLYAMTYYLKSKYMKGFTWKELPEIMQELVLYIGPNPAMSMKEKRVAALETLHYLLVSIDSLYLPEKATEPFFENMIPHFIYLAFTFPKDATLLKPTRSEPFTTEELDTYADELFAHFEGDLCWKNMSKAVGHALKIALSCTDCTQEEKGKRLLILLNPY